ncbi:aquaporin transporter [Culex quinquefasciatus]|uniref:Aquaporin transporter n=2 Tax=Culex pipiens complex TaxID=518105 RepID=B0XAC5_CULQU|nr:neurogenic protein big brain [Culex quinquefasciatus]XP_039435304.1 neurogenic protein big brain [Culex pipiens pallens]EDS43622.1 aquaporin transporter [Culex quinquefasciatus]|eukprot:XP_001866597.1 aquaporin transporter [Culex quinquefasciatus]
MAEESLHVPDSNIDYHIVQLFERLENLRREPGTKLSTSMQGGGRASMHNELRSLEFWRSITAECLASFFYVFIVCGAAAGAGVGASVSSVLLATALSSGFAVTALTQCFLHVSGAHINPAVTIALAVTRMISPLRLVLYLIAQCGGSIAGAAVLYGVTVPGYQGNLQAAVSHTSTLAAWERFGVEFILTFVVVLSYLISTNSYKKYFGSSAIAIGAAYSACSFVSMPYLNPARSLGPSFVLSKWDNHWVYWVGPLVGGIMSGLLHQFIFSTKKTMKKSKDDVDSSINSDEDINYDGDLDKPQQPGKYHTYRPQSGTLASQQRYCQSIYTAEPTANKTDRVESIYGGTKSMYCKSPPLTRANLSRSQSVYTKSNTALNRGPDMSIRQGPLVPAQSLYPLRVNPPQSSHLQNQNVQNQLQQRSESIYGIRSSLRQPQQGPNDGRMTQQMVAHPQQGDIQGFQPIYGTRNNPNCSADGIKFDREARENSRDDSMMSAKFAARGARPESMYGVSGQRRVQSAQSDDSSYGSYHGSGPAITPPTRNASNSSSNYNGGLMLPNYGPAGGPGMVAMNAQQMNQQQQERKASSSSSNQQQQQQQQQSNRNQQQQQVSIQGTNLPPPPPGMQNHQAGGYQMHPVRQN